MNHMFSGLVKAKRNPSGNRCLNIKFPRGFVLCRSRYKQIASTTDCRIITRPLDVCLTRGVMQAFNFETGTSNADDTEYGEIDPTKLFLEAMADDDEHCENEDGDVDAELSVANGF